MPVQASSFFLYIHIISYFLSFVKYQFSKNQVFLNNLRFDLTNSLFCYIIMMREIVCPGLASHPDQLRATIFLYNLCTKKGRLLLIRPIIEKSLQPQERKSIETALWVSDVGGCPRRAMFRVLGFAPERDFPIELYEKFQWGHVYEAETGRVLKKEFQDRLMEQFRLETKIWHGNVDFIISFPLTIIEHKATSDSGFNYIPKDTHLAQIVLYGQLYKELHNAEPGLILIYRAWSHYAEFNVTDLGSKIRVDGEIDNKPIRGEFWRVDVSKLREYLEKHFSLRELPPYKKTVECEWDEKPSCAYYNQCNQLRTDF